MLQDLFDTSLEVIGALFVQTGMPHFLYVTLVVILYHCSIFVKPFPKACKLAKVIYMQLNTGRLACQKIDKAIS